MYTYLYISQISHKNELVYMGTDKHKCANIPIIVNNYFVAVGEKIANQI